MMLEISKPEVFMRVSFFVTCVADQFGSSAAAASVRLLRRFGVEVSFPQDQTCCGQPAYNAGYADDARELAKHYLNVFEKSLETSDAVVVPSGSCGAMVHHYPELFAHDPMNLRRAWDVSSRVFELTQFLVEKLGVTHPGVDLTGVRVAYHDSCHAMRNMGVKTQPRMLLEAAGATLLAWDESCCGFGGLFSVKLPELSSAMMDRKLDSLAVDASEADVLTSTDLGCLMQLGGGLGRRQNTPPVVHIAQLLLNGKAAFEARVAREVLSYEQEAQPA
jgi:L-lactate dehydrogenase complex protein LldE